MAESLKLTVAGQRYHTLAPGDRKPWFIPLADGWDWHRYGDGVLSTRWITDGKVWICTNCGGEFQSSRSTPGHNKFHFDGDPSLTE